MQTGDQQPSFLSRIGPGLLVAATGVGAGDITTASFSGSQIGVSILWAVVVGALLKFALTEGLARWQLATGETFLEGMANRVGRWAGWVFLPYLVLWTFFVGSSLVSACGATLTAMYPLTESLESSKIIYGIAASLIGYVLVLRGGFALFQKVMAICIALMFVIVLITAGVLWPGTEAVLRGIFIPTLSDLTGSGLTWTTALLGGVGGTLTILCYGYWIEETGTRSLSKLRQCRLDLAVGYIVTAFFGLGMVVIGSSLELTGKGEGLLVAISDQLSLHLGSVGAWAFLIGALGAVFSSLLGVWQSVPYLFADVWRLNVQMQARPSPDARTSVDTEGKPYRLYLAGISIIPLIGLFFSFKEIQKIYALVGAAFIPFLAVGLLVMNGKRRWVGDAKNGWLSTLAYVFALLFFAWIAYRKFSA